MPWATHYRVFMSLLNLHTISRSLIFSDFIAVLWILKKDDTLKFPEAVGRCSSNILDTWGGGATQNNTAEDYSNSQTWDWFFRFIGFLSVSSGCNPPYLYSIALYTLEEKPRTSLFHTFFELRLRLFLDRKLVCRDHSTVHVILLKLLLYGNYLFFNSEAYLSSITHGAIERYICM